MRVKPEAGNRSGEARSSCRWVTQINIHRAVTDNDDIQGFQLGPTPADAARRDGLLSVRDDVVRDKPLI